MNFYTLTSKQIKKPRAWLSMILLTTFILSAIIIGFNTIIDPYNITQYNVLNIKYKFAREDRAIKLNHFATLGSVDNIIIGSSHVYSINPKIASKYLGGSSYNFGVGNAAVEDHLGIIKYLQREKKLPKNIIIGVDFYTFNAHIPPNKYFIKNKEINFLSYGNYKENYLSKLYSIDSFRASYKTLKHHLLDKDKKPFFDKDGWGGHYQDYSQRDDVKDLLRAKKETQEELEKVYAHYQHIDPKRIEYYEEIRKICKDNGITLYLFTTPLHPYLLDKLLDGEQKQAMDEWVKYLSSFEHFTNLYNNKKIYNDLRNFQGATHTSSNAGDIILELVL